MVWKGGQGVADWHFVRDTLVFFDDDEEVRRYYARDLLMELYRLATAYAVTKVLLPLRLIVSVWATPWFARRAVVPVKDFLQRPWRRKKI